jgi:hypothetical protein
VTTGVRFGECPYAESRTRGGFDDRFLHGSTSARELARPSIRELEPESQDGTEAAGGRDGR